jgi:nondiscriminating glutamyl-tRNA synthetase
LSVRTRFAPSPTGWLHVGGARTAYFNWLFARRHGGAFVVRIEDTDVERSSGESERGVLDDLEWLGLTPDEGPLQGGPYGPYRQSERLALYRERGEALRAAGRAYPCYCTDAELAQRREAMLARGETPRYDGRCRGLDAAGRAALEREGRPASLRFAVEPGETVLHDLVRGEVRFPAGMFGDFVLLRSNGLPTYNFAAAMDDAAMRISHVIRAEEHLPNTPRQLAIDRALGVEPPAFAHVPLILNADRSKMSKRSGEVSVAVGDWRRAGYTPEALLSYLALLGFHPGDEREVLSRDELLRDFSLERVGRSGSVFDPAKLRWMNAQYLHHASGATLARWAAPFLPEAARALPPRELERLLEVERGNLETLADLPRELEWFLAATPPREAEAAAALAAPGAPAVLEAAAEALAGVAEWRAEVVKSTLLSAGQRVGARGRELFQPVRAALTGRTHGPELPLVAELLGRERTVERLRAAARGGERPGGSR